MSFDDSTPDPPRTPDQQSQRQPPEELGPHATARSIPSHLFERIGDEHGVRDILDAGYTPQEIVAHIDRQGPADESPGRTRESRIYAVIDYLAWLAVKDHGVDWPEITVERTRWDGTIEIHTPPEVEYMAVYLASRGASGRRVLQVFSELRAAALAEVRHG